MANSSATIKTDYLLKADSFLILCPTASATAYSHFGPTLAISGFPSLNNEEGEIILSSPSGTVIHAIHYDKSWYKNELKAKGGWSLEMIDLHDPCAGKENWTSSISDSGGTPGYMNSVEAYNPDEQPPSLVGAVTVDSVNIILLFDEPLDSFSTSAISNYLVSDGIGYPDSILVLPPFFDQVAIQLQNPLAAGKVYLISVQQIGDCNGNEIGQNNIYKLGIPEKSLSGDIIFNEILFNPPPYGYDYLELYNRSSRIIRCSDLFLAGKNMMGLSKILLHS